MVIVYCCGYPEINSDGVILSYNDIIHLQSLVLETQENPRGYARGPQIDQILEKSLPTFPCLATLDVKATVEFYDNFQKASVIYLLPTMTFDCISNKVGFEGALCPPGLGFPWYAIFAWVLMELLPCLLPHANTQVTLLINMVHMESGNGYDLMWHILALLVPGFDPSIAIEFPIGRTRVYLTLPWHSSCSIGYRPKRVSSRTTTPAAPCFSMGYTSRHMLMLLPL
jgi:hypothetical protein